MEDITIPRVSLDWQQISNLADENSSIATAYIANVTAWKQSLDQNDPDTQSKVSAVNSQIQLMGQHAVALLGKLNSVIGKLPNGT